MKGKQHFDPIIKVEPDGLFTPKVREWSLEKYKLVGTYCDIFTAGMKNKWDQLVYIDLFAGGGYAEIEETKKIYKNSCLIAMSIPNPFTKYILCEQDNDRFYALEKRIARDYKHLNISLVQGDSNVKIQEIKKLIPTYNKDNTLLPFCFIDPFSLNLNFETIRALSENLMDFLILQALHMDANRNFDKYVNEENTKIASYLGLPEWRKLFERTSANKKDFVKFLADNFQNQMVSLGHQTSKHMHHIRSNEKNLPLYYLSFYSKHPRGEDFFSKVQNRVKPQMKLDLDFE